MTNSLSKTALQRDSGLMIVEENVGDQVISTSSSYAY